eukprot:Blabericola_migrator_1__3233@NODE_1951_length_3515_cov_24_442865_g934_i1_p1_GENE_NODE_1951_length_3515_cov_24_442865_g934_i1NODE_1951_length_3515_cov_24_442865_g934_i1_p1_ORF_typecomplete_len801_score82_89RVT_1/PF00078_27/9_7e15RVP/PF00077_20/3_9e08gagasp_proteas/PF13975_6/2_2e02gagasp_proteas/PF13975_6/0_00091RVP_2/PF08284_11/0_0002Asp_protease_2/PF13650_6/4_6e02Asp_protease_2/PF13650_6/1_6Dala_Dala_lig_C/PF07478_13/1_1Dala_Dala_lig_C/PF07478_13/8_2e02_NODE_1951_length_3515_cov_24_442865_g934_i
MLGYGSVSEKSKSSSRSSTTSETTVDQVGLKSKKRATFKTLSTSDRKDLHKLLGRIGESRVYPASETELDAFHKRLVDESKVYGFGRHLIIHALYNLSTEHMKKQFPKDIPDGEEPDQDVVDHLARKLFPFSYDLVELRSTVTHGSPCLTVNAAMTELQEVKERHRKLCHRWSIKDRLTKEELRVGLLRRVPTAVRTAYTYLPNTRSLSLTELFQNLSEIESNMRTLHADPSLHLVGTSDDNTPVIATATNRPIVTRRALPKVAPRATVATPPTPDVPPPVLRRCRWCQSPQHSSYYCTKKPTCPHCGRAGHDADVCWSTKRNAKVGDRAISVTKTNQGLLVRVQDEKNAAEIYDMISKYTASRAAATAKAYQSAAVRRQTQDAARRAASSVWAMEETPQPQSPTPSAEAATPAPTLNLNRVAFNIPPKDELLVRVDGTTISAQIDGGADCSVLAEHLLPTLPSHIKSAWEPSEEQEEVRLAAGTTKLKGYIDLPVQCPLGNVLERFLVIHGCNTTLLGRTWLTAIKALVDYNTRTIRNDHGELSLLTAGIDIHAIEMAEEKFTEADLQARCDSKLDDNQRQAIVDILKEHKEIYTHTKPGACLAATCKVNLKDGAEPVYQPPRYYSPEQEAESIRQVHDLEKAGAVRPSESPWCARQVMVPKKGGEVRICVDYRDLNKLTIPDAFPLPPIEMILKHLAEAKYFIALDLKAGYHQIPMHPDSIPLTAFATPDGLYEYLVMPFGLRNAPAIFQRMVQKIFAGMLYRSAVVYIDDIVIYAKTFEDLCTEFREACRRLRQYQT